MNPRLLAILSIVTLFSASSDLVAESDPSDWFFRAWQTEDGLPDNSISGLAQSSDGYLWIATNGGAIRFNGSEFNPLPLREIPELPSQQVRTMFLDRTGKLWLGMERGPLIRIGENSFHAFHRGDGIPDNVTKAIIDDPAGNIWVVFSGQVNRLNGDEVTAFGPAEGTPAGAHASLACDSDGQVWLSTDGKLGRLNQEGFELVRDFNPTSVRIAANRDSGLWLTAGSDLIHLDSGNQSMPIAKLPEETIVNAIYEDRGGAVWLCTENEGLFRFKEGVMERVATSHATIDCITEDQEGNIWAGTGGGGLNLIRPRAVEFIETANGLPFSSVRSTTCSTSGRIWAVSPDGRLAYRDSQQWQLFEQAGAATVFTCVAADAQDRVWAGTYQEGLLMIQGSDLVRFHKEEGLGGRFVRSLLTARNGDVWIATDEPDELHRLRNGKITRINHPVSFSAIRALAEAADGTIWAGSSDGLLFRVEGDRLVDESAIDGPLALSIRALHSTPDGSLWIGYAGDGLGHLKDGQYSRITTEAGLHDNYISQIQDDGEGSLWLAANRGLFQVSLEELLAVSADSESNNNIRCRVFGRNDGMPSMQPSRDYAPTTYRSPDGHLYFSTHSGILKVQPNRIRENSLPPPVTLEKVSVDNRVVAVYMTRSMLQNERNGELTNLGHPNPRLDLLPDHDKLVVNFAALSLGSPENVQLRYRLFPFDKNWEEVANRHSVTFPRLPAGNYKFQVIGCNNVGVWNEEGATLGLTVHPFIWETWWFRTGGGLLTAFVAGGLVFLGLRRKHLLQLKTITAKQALEQERSRIARDIHDDLGASLTRITLLSQASPSQEGESSHVVFDQIHTTAQHLMRSMEEVVWAVNPEHDTFDALANYLSNYGQGFLGVAGVRCRLELPLALPERPLSAQLRHNLFLAFKEALNNAVKHAGATEVRISLKLRTRDFVLKVEDNGKGIDPDPDPSPMRSGPGNGLTNMKSRMDEIGGTCILHSTLGKGTTVEFHVPFKINPMGPSVT